MHKTMVQPGVAFPSTAKPLSRITDTNNMEEAAEAVAFVPSVKYEQIPVMVHIIAPSTLPESYKFEAEVGHSKNKKTISVTVPEGGVVKGQVFLVPLPPDFGSGNSQVRVPTGHWRDGIFDCCNEGPCHPSFWCAFCCPTLALGQLMQRMGFDWFGRIKHHPDDKKATFWVVFSLSFAYIALRSIISANYPVKASYVYWIFTIWFVFALMNVRKNIRAKYSIPKQVCSGCEDFMCSFCCSSCVIAQIARHTGEYKTYEGSCCSTTGMAAHTPSIV